MAFYDSGKDMGGRTTPTPEPKAPTSCPACSSRAISTTSKNPSASSYWRCETCGEVWNADRYHGERNAPSAPWR